MHACALWEVRLAALSLNLSAQSTVIYITCDGDKKLNRAKRLPFGSCRNPCRGAHNAASLVRGLLNYHTTTILLNFSPRCRRWPLKRTMHRPARHLVGGQTSQQPLVDLLKRKPLALRGQGKMARPACRCVRRLNLPAHFVSLWSTPAIYVYSRSVGAC